VNVDVVDPHADSEELQHEYGLGLQLIQARTMMLLL
jgi:hypothetical protein